MCRRGERLREMHTASTSEGTATPTLSKAQGVKLPQGFGAKPEDPRSQPLTTMVTIGAVIQNAICLHHC